MLNYIFAELYKLRRHKFLFVGTALLLFLESLVFQPFFWTRGELVFSRTVLNSFFTLAIMVGLVISPIFAALAFDDQHGYSTLKNEVVFGIPRSRIYIGKWLTGALAGTAVALLATGWYFLLTALVSHPADSAQILTVEKALTDSLPYTMSINWAVWLSTYSFTFFLLMLLHNSTAAILLTYALTLIWTPIALVSWGGRGESPFWYQLITQCFYTTPLRYVFGGPIEGGSLFGWVGERVWLYVVINTLLWTVGLSALGLWLFARREVK